MNLRARSSARSVISPPRPISSSSLMALRVRALPGRAR